MSSVPEHVVAGLDQRMAIAGHCVDEMVAAFSENPDNETELERAVAMFHAIRDVARALNDPREAETLPIELAVVAMLKLAAKG